MSGAASSTSSTMTAAYSAPSKAHEYAKRPGVLSIRSRSTTQTHFQQNGVRPVSICYEHYARNFERNTMSLGYATATGKPKHFYQNTTQIGLGAGATRMIASSKKTRKAQRLRLANETLKNWKLKTRRSPRRRNEKTTGRQWLQVRRESGE